MQKTSKQETTANPSQILPAEQGSTFTERLQGVLKDTRSSSTDTPVQTNPEEGKAVEAKIIPDAKQTEKLFEIKSLTTNLTPKKVVKLLLLLLMVFAIVGALYVRFIRKSPVRITNILVNEPTPTYSPYQKYKPSIYAQDTNFKKIDEGINVLGNEVKNTTLEEQILLPPNLDFDVHLK